MWKLWQTRGLATAGAIASLSVAMLIASATVTSAGSQALSGSQVQGCCVCRGTEGGNASTVRSCSDGVNVDTCVSQCEGQNADSIAFGYKQTCSQGCAGFPTQSLH
jgi:hypothetical protein